MPSRTLELPNKIDLAKFLSTHAHDLRTPYNHITGFSKMLINTVNNDPLDDMQKDDLNTIYRSGMRALLCINGLIEISRIERGEKEINRAEFGIQPMLERGLSTWKKFHPGSQMQVEIRRSIASGLIFADEMLCQQLLSNSISFVGLFCESLAKIIVSVGDDASDLIFTFQSEGEKVRQVSELDLEMLGYVCQASIRIHAGEILRAEELKDGAILQFNLPKDPGS